MIQDITQLRRVYTNAEYRVPGAGLVIRIDRYPPYLDRFLFSNDISRFAIITSDNPGSVLSTDRENRKRRQSLESRVRNTGWQSFRAENRDPDGHWPTEYGLLICEIPREEAEVLGGQFGQNAIVYGRRGTKPGLIWLLP